MNASRVISWISGDIAVAISSSSGCIRCISTSSTSICSDAEVSVSSISVMSLVGGSMGPRRSSRHDTISFGMRFESVRILEYSEVSQNSRNVSVIPEGFLDPPKSPEAMTGAKVSRTSMVVGRDWIPSRRVWNRGRI